MYMTYMAHEQITAYATMLIQNDLLSFNNYGDLFSTTAKGLKFLELYDRMEQNLVLKDKEEQQLEYNVNNTGY